MRRSTSILVAFVATAALLFGGATAASAETDRSAPAATPAVPAGPVSIAPDESIGGPRLAVTGHLGVLTIDVGPAFLDEATGEISHEGESETRFSVGTDDGSSLTLAAERLPAGLVSGSEITAVLAVPDAVADAVPSVGRSQSPVAADSAIGASVIASATELDAEFAIVSAEITPAVAAAGTVQPLKVAVVAPAGSGISPSFYSNAQVATLAGNLGGFWEGQSEGRIADIPLDGDIKHYTSGFGRCAAGKTDEIANVIGMWNEALAAFGIPGTWESAAYNGTHVAVLTPDLDCDYIGLGTIGSPVSGGIFQSVVGIGLDDATAEHEFGHNLGLGHANRYGCTDPAFVEDGTGCGFQAYGDWYDVMGIGLCTGSGTGSTTCWNKPGALNVLDRLHLGWQTVPGYALPAGESRQSWTVRIDAASASGGTRGALFVDPITNYEYFVEYRSGTGIDAASYYAGQPATSTYRPGVRLTFPFADGEDGTPSNESNVQTVMPNSSQPGFRSLALQQGDTFGSQAAGLSVSVASISGGVATVTVTVQRDNVLAPALRAPRITGGTAIGSTLSIVDNNWTLPGLDFDYAWLRDGVPLGIGGTSYTTVAADEGARITAQITAGRAGYLDGTTTTNVITVDSRPHVFIDVLPTHPFFADIEWMSSSGLSNGYANADGTRSYRPLENVSRQAMAAFLYRESGETFTAPTTPSFVDVPTSHPFFREIEWMKSAGISTGTKNADGTVSYNPNGAVSREAMAAFLARMSGDTIPTPTSQVFVDVPPTNAFYKEITWMNSTGISTGYSDHTYRPAAPVSRQAMAAFLHRYDAKFGD